MPDLGELLAASAAMHHHLCPRQVLGVRMGLLAGDVLGLDLPQTERRLLTIVETDGCAADGISVATNCWVGQRTLRVEDYGKVAATFADARSGMAVRIVPRPDARQLAANYAPMAATRWEAQLLGYQRMPAGELLGLQTVQLTTPVAKLISKNGRKAHCDGCGEEINNEREIRRDGRTLCRACAGLSYYQPAGEVTRLAPSLVPAAYACFQAGADPRPHPVLGRTQLAGKP